MNITLQEVTKDNWEAVVALSTHDHQRYFVASNAYSLTQSKYEDNCRPLAIYNDTELVGFTMYHVPVPENENECWISRLMIDKAHQQQGYGHAALIQVIDVIKRDLSCNHIYISFEPENSAAKTLYESLGFKPDGRVLEGEIVYVLNY